MNSNDYKDFGFKSAQQGHMHARFMPHVLAFCARQKNVALSLAGRWDAHANPLWDGGHIKLWSRHTLAALLREAGFENLQFRGVGRLPFVWMTMVMSGDRPSS